jgi:hypothetical protein
MALFGRLPEQPRRLRLILLHALALEVADTKVSLRLGMALLGRLRCSRAAFASSFSTHLPL